MNASLPTPIEFEVEGPVQAEVFVVWRNGERLELTGPCGAAPWYIEVGAGEHPLEVVTRLATAALGIPRLVHSTSWRRDREAVVLSFLVVVDASQVGDDRESVPIGRSELARSAATAAPLDISYTQVLEHALRHLAWLARDDPVVSAELEHEWQVLLGSYVPEPFRALGV
jgi:hypothetical protein